MNSSCVLTEKYYVATSYTIVSAAFQIVTAIAS